MNATLKSMNKVPLPHMTKMMVSGKSLVVNMGIWLTSLKPKSVCTMSGSRKKPSVPNLFSDWMLITYRVAVSSPSRVILVESFRMWIFVIWIILVIFVGFKYSLDNYIIGLDIFIRWVHGVFSVSNAKLLRLAAVEILLPRQAYRIFCYVDHSKIAWQFRLIFKI